jgi:hypothetical protein
MIKSFLKKYSIVWMVSLLFGNSLHAQYQYPFQDPTLTGETFSRQQQRERQG